MRDDLASVQQIEQVFVQTGASSWSVLLIVDKYDAKAEKKIIEVEGELIDAFPWLDVDFDVVYRDGRPLADVVSPKGFQLFAR